MRLCGKHASASASAWVLGVRGWRLGPYFCLLIFAFCLFDLPLKRKLAAQVGFVFCQEAPAESGVEFLPWAPGVTGSDEEVKNTE